PTHYDSTDGRMKDWTEVLRALADSPEEFEHQGGVLFFPRRGRDHLLEVRELPGLGVAVAPEGSKEPGTFTPIASFIQAELLQLPQLARSLVRTLDKTARARPVPYIDG